MAENPEKKTESLEKKIRYEKIENAVFKVGAYVSGIVGIWSIGLGAYLFNDNNYSNGQIGMLLGNAVSVLALGYVCNGVAKRGKEIVSKLEEELNERRK